MTSYQEFVRSKMPVAESLGFEPPSEPHPSLFPHQKDVAAWLVRGGRRACFKAFGLGKTRTQLQVAKWIVEKTDRRYRLGWTENSKDSTKMGVGMPEYVLLFRKLPTDTSTAYADVPVIKDKADYTRAQWQIDASSFWKSDGAALPTPEQLVNMPMDAIGRLWREYSRRAPYDYRTHVEIGKELEKRGKLPASFMLFPPVSNNPMVWTDIPRMRVLNSEQSKRNQENHVCPLQAGMALSSLDEQLMGAICTQLEKESA
jgi:hypothetical protein